MEHPALLLIDVQEGLKSDGLGNRNNPEAEVHMASLLQVWREHAAPVLHVKHDSTEPESVLRPGLPGNAIQSSVQPLDSEPLFTKTVNSAFIGTKLEEHLHQNKIGTLVVVGLTTDHCVSSSVRMASNLGFRVYLVEDGTATFDRTGPDGQHHSAESMHTIHLASLNGEFCSVLNTAQAKALIA
ncbi:MAG: cysteine hydrolase [Gammaproteobacteria bacterium]|nr:cysteine hydrolase [Gammaproteobacteria bacterium]